MVAEESSIRLEIPRCRNFRLRRWMSGRKSGWPESGTRSTLVGAIVGGNERTYGGGMSSSVEAEHPTGPGTGDGGRALTPRASLPSRVQ